MSITVPITKAWTRRETFPVLIGSRSSRTGYRTGCGDPEEGHGAEEPDLQCHDEDADDEEA